MKSRVVMTAASLGAAVLLPTMGGTQTIGGVAPDPVDRESATAGARGAGIAIGVGVGGTEFGSVLTTSGLVLDVPILGFGETTIVIRSGSMVAGPSTGSTSTLTAPSSLLGPLDLGTNPPFTSFGRFLPGVGANASGTRPAPRLRTPSAAPSAATSSGGVVWDSFCDPRDFTCDQ